jgi:HSP20 family protein
MTLSKEDAMTRPAGGVPMIHPELRRRVTPAVDVYETTDGYVLRVDLPGATKEGIGLQMERGILTVTAETAPLFGPGGRPVYGGPAVFRYERSFTIGDGVDQSHVDARFEDGVLTVKLFRKEEHKPRTIKVQ